MRGLVGETRRGRRPRSRFEAGVAPQAPARLVGQACPPAAWTADAVGRVLARLDARGTMPLVPAWAVRAAARLRLACRSGPLAPTACRVWGDDQGAEARDVPCQLTAG